MNQYEYEKFMADHEIRAQSLSIQQAADKRAGWPIGKWTFDSLGRIKFLNDDDEGSRPK